MNQKHLIDFVNHYWDSDILPVLEQYISIPNKSPAFDAEWQKNGHMDRAVDLAAQWCQRQNLCNMTVTIHRIANKTPLLSIDIAGDSEKTVLLYGHLDKQPEMTGWAEDLHPWKPVRRNDRLYGRGSADDGYAVFAAMTAIKALQQQNIPHARCLILIETCEESGSNDLPFYIEQLQQQIGDPDLIVCLDSGCGNYEQFWSTTSLRGSINGVLRVNILKEGVHSGAASGVVPSSFRILRQLLSRLEDENTGKIRLDALQVEIPPNRKAEAQSVATALGEKIWTEFPFFRGAKPTTNDPYELVLNRTWRATLALTGIEGMPSLKDAGNVLRPETSIMLSIRIPPICNAQTAVHAIKTTLETNPPYSADVSFDLQKAATGWNAPLMQPWLSNTVNQASIDYFGKTAVHWGEGGSIPFMGMLGEKFPQAQFVITGVLGPQSNAHGPNEFLHIPTVKKLTCCIAEILAQHFMN